MRIAFVANAWPPWFLGGAEIAAHRQAVELVRRGHAALAFCAVSDPSRPPYEVVLHVVDGVEVTRVNVPGPRFKPARNFLNGVVDALFARFLERERPDVVHLHNVPGLSLGVVDAAEAAGTPMLATFHDHWGFCLRNTLVREGETRLCPNWSDCEVCLPQADLGGLALPTFLRTGLIRAKLHKAARFHFPSRSLMASYVAAGFDASRAQVRSNGLPPRWFEGEVERPAGDPLRVAFVGFMGPHKGPDVLLDALERVEAAGRLSRMRVDLYGSGTLDDALEAKIAARGWGALVSLHGRRDPARMMAVYREADVLVNASRWPENEPVTLLESLASGTPVITTATGGNVELVREGWNGWLTPPGDADVLASRLIALADDPAALAARRPAARASVAGRTLAAYADFAEASYAELRTVGAEALPSLVAVACEDYARVNVPALKRVSRTGAWADAEWVPAETLAGASERGALRAVVALGGRLSDVAAQAIDAGVPAFAVGRAGAATLSGAPDLRYVADFAALAAAGERAASRVLERA